MDPEVCYRALSTRDERFDGRLFVGVTSTGIYCRPVCTARAPLAKNCRFYPSAAAAQEAGFRPCLRCRPETSLDLGSWRGTSNTVSRGLALIADGQLDAEDATVASLAERLGVGERQLRRLFQQHLGASPIAVAQTRRVLFAKQLVHETDLPMAEIALAAGFGSLRRFNETFRALYGKPPSALRRRKNPLRREGVTVRLRYRAPYDWNELLEHFRYRAIEGVERVDENRYSRTIALDGVTGTVSIGNLPSADALVVNVRFPSVRSLPAIVARVRRVFDLGADAEAIHAHLARDPMLAPMVAARPGLRSPGAWDGFEYAIRAVLGQQISVVSAKKLAGKVAAQWGTKLPDAEPGLSLAFPTALQLSKADFSSLGMPNARRRTLAAIAAASVADPTLFDPQATIEETVARLCKVPGIGEWTAQMIALRAAREPDAFPASDIGLLRGAEVRGKRPTPAALAARAETWRPWRAYAAQHLWVSDHRKMNE